MRTLSTNSAAITAFVNQSLPEARNPRDSVWFKGDRLYSYESPLATINPNRTIFINSDLVGYSNTTSKHIAYLRNIAKDLQIFTIPLDLTTDQTLDWYWDMVIKHIAKYLRARTTRDLHKSLIKQTIHTIESYVDYMQISKSNPTYLRKHDITKQLFEHQIL